MPLRTGLGALALAAAPAADRIRELARQIIGDGDYQADLPTDPVLPKLDLPPGLLRVLVWIALGMLVVLAVTWLARRLARPVPDADVPEEATAAPVSIQIPGAEAFAREGRFTEAVHALLLETLEALSRASRLAPSLTSREIVQRVRLAARARDALGGLVTAVEVSRFGGTPASEADYRACLARFRSFLDSYRSAA